MDRSSPYYGQVALLIQLLPFVARENCFALKGGTAINLFVRDFPRLSVDIDLVYLVGIDHMHPDEHTYNYLISLIYVAMTRAKFRLIIPYVEKLN